MKLYKYTHKDIIVLKIDLFLIEMSDNRDIQKNKYIFFLENLLTKLRDNKISSEEERELSEFYINYMFKRENIENDEKKIEKYISLGWYIYEILNNKDNIIKSNE